MPTNVDDGGPREQRYDVLDRGGITGDGGARRSKNGGQREAISFLKGALQECSRNAEADVAAILVRRIALPADLGCVKAKLRANVGRWLIFVSDTGPILRGEIRKRDTGCGIDRFRMTVRVAHQMR